MMHPTKTETIFPHKGFTEVTGVEEYTREQRKDFIREMNSILHDEDCDCSECLGIPSGVMAAPSWCPSCKQLRAEVALLREEEKLHESHAKCAREKIEKLRAENAEAKTIIRWVLDWVDAVPSDTQLPTMPGFDRDYVENFLSGEVDDE